MDDLSDLPTPRLGLEERRENLKALRRELRRRGLLGADDAEDEDEHAREWRAAEGPLAFRSDAEVNLPSPGAIGSPAPPLEPAEPEAPGPGARRGKPIGPASPVSPEEHRRRMAEGRRLAALEGYHVSGPCPYGYVRTWPRVGGRPVLAQKRREAAVVRMIFREYLRLRSLARLQRCLADRGLRHRRGTPWSRYALAWILHNPVYVGRVRYGGVEARGVHEPIVAPIIFNKAVKLLRDNDKRAARRLPPEAPPTVPFGEGECDRGELPRFDSGMD